MQDEKATTSMCAGQSIVFKWDEDQGKSVFGRSSFQLHRVEVETNKRVGGNGNVPIVFSKLSPELQEQWDTVFATLCHATFQEVKEDYPNDASVEEPTQ